eukprot:TRINITY_DN13967_c0_g1_i4.p1 TRINITY_DN13967_c0_g1~~TRINITY_DN13967_c0_g1_i4.p1  ORF type:complete len:240 (+),score=52.24 TRINITY_DN13967_c0_g1_i4:106-825(+)
MCIRDRVYYKRSRVLKMDGVLKHNCGNWDRQTGVDQWAYSGSHTMLRAPRIRDLAVACVLRTTGTSNIPRRAVVETTQALVERLGVPHQINGFLGSGGPGVLWMQDAYEGYFNVLNRAKIIVTCNPSYWEGDFRLWEAMLSGALVFVDNATYLHQIPDPVIHQQHLILYNVTDKPKLTELLTYYIQHEDEAAAIARAGYLHVRRYHMAVNRVDMLLRTASERLASRDKETKSGFFWQPG